MQDPALVLDDATRPPYPGPAGAAYPPWREQQAQHLAVHGMGVG